MRHRSERFISLATRDTLALILAGGRGTRLGGLTRQSAKPAVPFGGKFRIIDFPLSNCMNSGIRRVSVLSQYMAHPLIRHLQQGWSFLRGEFGEFIEVLPAQQRLGESWYRGTADAVRQNLDIIRDHQPQFVLILGGDHVYKMDYGTMLGAHVERDADVTVGCVDVPIGDAESFGVMSVDENGLVNAFQEKPEDPAPIPGQPDRALASMGIYVFNTDYLLAMLEASGPGGSDQHDFGGDLIPAAVDAGDKVFAYSFRNAVGDRPAYWRDVGTLDAYWAANLELVGVTPELNLYDETWPIWTYQEQVPPAKFVFDDEGRRGTAVDSMVSGGCIVSGATVRRSVLFSSVLVAARSVIESSVLLPDVAIGRDCRIRNAIVETACHVPGGTTIGYDRQDDARRFEVTDDGVVLVTIDALGRCSD